MNRLELAVRDVVRRLFPQLDFLALYPATVKAQNSDGTLELVADDIRLPAYPKVALRLGLPGIAVKVSKNARVLLGFEGGNPLRPVATIWEVAGLKELLVTADTKVTVSAPSVLLGDGSAFVGRVGDAVAPHSTMATWIAGVTTAINTLAPGSATPPSGFANISAGSNKVKA